MALKTSALICEFLFKSCKGPMENSLFDFLDTLNQILLSILFESASKVNWDKLTVIEMVEDIESVSQRDWFICHIF